MAAAESLHQDEAVLLATALVDHVAASAGIPVLFIKGPGATMMGLRENHVSADVDVLVRPEQLGALVGLLGERGWLERPSGASVVRRYTHSRTLYHPQWNSDIDVHNRFPGIEAPDVFSTLWRDRHYLTMAARSVPVPSVPAAVIFQALHSLRAMDDPRHQREYSGLLQRVDATMHQQILQLSDELQATAALKPLLEDLGVADLPAAQGPVSEEWRHRTTVRAPGMGHLAAFMESPWKIKPFVIAQALWPSRQILRSRNLYLDESAAGLARAHAARWRRGLARIPETARRLRAKRGR